MDTASRRKYAAIEPRKVSSVECKQNNEHGSGGQAGEEGARSAVFTCGDGQHSW